MLLFDIIIQMWGIISIQLITKVFVEYANKDENVTKIIKCSRIMLESESFICLFGAI